jgi:hypothetical protein
MTCMVNVINQLCSGKGYALRMNMKGLVCNRHGSSGAECFLTSMSLGRVSRREWF